MGFSPVPMYGCDARFDTWQILGPGKPGILSLRHFVAWAFSLVVPNEHVIALPRVLVEALYYFLFFSFF